jgi:hypothetical protein
MNPEFWNIFPVSSRGFSGRIPVGIVPSPVGHGKNRLFYLALHRLRISEML